VRADVPGNGVGAGVRLRSASVIILLPILGFLELSVYEN
jgi:hypothetical protein